MAPIDSIILKIFDVLHYGTHVDYFHMIFFFNLEILTDHIKSIISDISWKLMRKCLAYASAGKWTQGLDEGNERKSDIGLTNIVSLLS